MNLFKLGVYKIIKKHNAKTWNILNVEQTKIKIKEQPNSHHTTKT